MPKKNKKVTIDVITVLLVILIVILVYFWLKNRGLSVP